MADYEIGYCKPPKHTQFKKGTSGNPNGRPKRPATMSSVLENALRETVTVLDGGKQKTVSKMEAAVKRLVDNAIAGDMSAFRVLSVLAQTLQDSPNLPSSRELEEADKKILERLAREFASAERP